MTHLSKWLAAWVGLYICVYLDDSFGSLPAWVRPYVRLTIIRFESFFSVND